MKVLKKILLFIGIINFLEAINVLVNENTALQFGKEIPYVTHGVFHVAIGLIFTLIGIKVTKESGRTVTFLLASIGLLLLANGLNILISQQQAIKFGYELHYLLHATYYLSLGAFIAVICTQLYRRQAADSF